VSSKAFLAALSLLACTLLGCSPAEAPDSVLKPLEEARARAIIEDAIRAGGFEPTAPHVIKLRRDGAALSEDMRIDKGPYSVAYLTYDEEHKLAGSIAERDPADDRLRLEQGVEGEVVLILWAQNYRFDAGEEHSATAITAERKLKRDVSDFIQNVVRSGKGQ
jgi:hypothetical protein